MNGGASNTSVTRQTFLDILTNTHSACTYYTQGVGVGWGGGERPYGISLVFNYTFCEMLTSLIVKLSVLHVLKTREKNTKMSF